jgi:hypothetical protein
MCTTFHSRFLPHEDPDASLAFGPETHPRASGDNHAIPPQTQRTLGVTMPGSPAQRLTITQHFHSDPATATEALGND